MKRLLFISHSSSRTGAPIALLKLVSWIKDHSDYRCDIFLRHDGSMAAEFAGLGCKVYKSYGLLHRCLRPLVYLRMRANRYSLIFSNTIANGRVLRRLYSKRVPIVTYVHELPYIISLFADDFALTKRYSSKFICVSEAVCRNLVENHRIAPELTAIAYNASHTGPVPAATKASLRAAVRKELNATPEDKILLGCGTLDWRKGSDIFVLLAVQMLKAEPDASLLFVWVGGNEDEFEHRQRRYELDLLGWKGRILFVGKKEDPRDYFAAADLLLMTSREDPCPLVMSEAGLMGCPMVCFRDAGGAEEFANDGAGVAVPFLDLSAFAAAIQELLSDPARRQRLGEGAQTRALARHTLERAGSSILAMIDATASDQSETAAPKV